MKKILILVDKIGPKKEFFAQEIAQRVGKDKQIVLARFSDIYFELEDKKISVEIDGVAVTNYDLIFFRRAGTDFSVAASTLAVCLKYLGVKFFDTTWSDIGPLGSKFTSLIKLGLEGLPIFPTAYVWAGNIEKYSKRISKSLGLPLIAKELSTQLGKGVHKIETLEDFKKLPMQDSKGGNNQYLFQKFADIDHEYRVLVLGEQARVWEEKIADKSEFRHNVSLGAREEFLDVNQIPKEMASIAVRAAKALNIQMAGVDVATEKKTGRILLIEVNRGPGLTYDTSVSPELAEVAKFLDRESN